MVASGQFFDSSCRTCMSELAEASSHDGNTKSQQQWQSIFDRSAECGAFRIAEVLTNAVPQIEVQSSDELPKRICSKCLQQLLSVFQFQQMCVQSEQQMRQEISKKKNDPSIPTATMEGATGTDDADSYSLTTTVESSRSHQNLKDYSIQEPLLETTEQWVKPEAAETSDIDIDKLLEDCRDSQGNFSEFIKNERIEDKEPRIESSDGATTHSGISMTDEGLPIEMEQQQINKTYIVAHRITYNKDKPYECPHCTQTFTRKYNMLRHKPICGKRCLEQHKLTHSDDKRHKCDLCEMRVIELHRITYNKDQPTECPHCNKAFTRKYNMLRHKAICSKRCLEQHKLTHSGEKRHKNDLCEMSGAGYECPYCPRRFSYYTLMLRHKETHGETKQELCDICGKTISKGHLNQHKLTHSDDMPYKCHICEKRFTGKDHLRAHLRKHTGEKPYKCKYCECSFTQSTSYKQHMRRLHLGDNVHRCELCPLAFLLATHKNEDPETRDRNMKALKEAEAKGPITVYNSTASEEL